MHMVMELTVKNHHRAMYDARPGPGEELQLGQGERNEGRETGHHMHILIRRAARPRRSIATPQTARHAAYCTLV